MRVKKDAAALADGTCVSESPALIRLIELCVPCEPACTIRHGPIQARLLYEYKYVGVKVSDDDDDVRWFLVWRLTRGRSSSVPNPTTTLGW